jgi:hypothetical protein
VQRAPTKLGDLELMLSFLILVKKKTGAEHFHEQKQRTVFYAWFAHPMKLVAGGIVFDIRT